MIDSSNTPSPFSTPWNLSYFSSQFQPSRSEQSGSHLSSERANVTNSGRKGWALVVDDVTDVTDMLAVLLTHAGYEVSTASCAQDALALAREHRFDFIISDIGMPEMNGYELAKALRALPGYEAVPMVAVTGYSMFDDRARSLTAGFNEHVTKPISPRAFLDLIEQL